MSGAETKPAGLRSQRRPSRHSCWDYLIAAPLWVAYDANLALQVGDILRGRRPCIHWVAPTKEGWIAEQRLAGKRIVAVELAEGATSLPLLTPARESTVLLLGHEHTGGKTHLGLRANRGRPVLGIVKTVSAFRWMTACLTFWTKWRSRLSCRRPAYTASTG